MEASSLASGATALRPADQHREWPPGDKTASSAPQTDDEEEETTANCSEAMMSSERDESPGGRQRHSTIERQRLQSGRNRLGTPRHELTAGRLAAGGGRPSEADEHCDRVQGRDDEFALIGAGQQREQPDESSGELSLASGQNQNPPSYGTATRSCATLDAGQLQQLHFQRLAAGRQQSTSGQNCHQINHTEHNNNSNNNNNNNGQRASLNCVSLADLAAILNGSDRAPGGGSQPIDDSYGFLAGRHTDKNQRGDQLQQRPPLAQVGLVDLGAPSATLQRQLDLVAISGGGNVASLLSGSLVKKRDEGIYATLNVTQTNNNNNHHHHQQQQPQPTTTTGATTTTQTGDNTQQSCGPFQLPPPQAAQINHVISARASMQQQQQQQQQRALQLQAGQHQQQVWALARGGATQPRLNQSNGDPQRHLAPAYGLLERGTSEGASTDLLAASGGRQKWRATNDFDGTAERTGAHLNDGQNNRHQLQATQTTSANGGRQHRRRRHKSTSGASSQHDVTTRQAEARPTRGSASAAPSSSASKDGAKMDATAGANAARATISAHCWLIDSGDDDDERERGGQARRADTGRRLTQRARHSQTLRPFSRRRSSGGNFATLATIGARSGASSRRRVHQVHSAQSSASLGGAREANTSDGHGLWRRTAKSCASSSSAYSNASTVVRLSAMLNFVSNLMSGRSRSARNGLAASSKYAKSNRRSSSTSNIHMNQEEAICLGQTAATIQSRYHSGAASSLAYSSSTSAYVTGNSSMHSHDCGSTFVHVPLGSFVQQPVINRAAVQTGAGHHAGQSSQLKLVAPVANYQPGSFAPNSHHSYEYCDTGPEHKQPDGSSYNPYDNAANHSIVRDEQIELATLGGEGRSQTSTSSNAEELAPDSAASTCSPAQLVGLNQSGLIGNRLGGPTQLAQVVMSDNELIGGGLNSTASDCNSVERPRRCRQSGRRWWWDSFGFVWSSRRLNSTDEDDDESLTRSRPAGPPNAPSGADATSSGATNSAGNLNPRRRAQPTRYRSLKSSGGCASTLDNVISLAKIDRVFRCRLLASLLVSAILFALICLLIVIIFRRNSPPAVGGLHSSLRLQSAWSRFWPNFGLIQSPSPFEPSSGSRDDNSQLNFDEFDVSWLWSPNDGDNGRGWPGYGRQRHLADENDTPQRHQTALDANLRSLLHVIDRSERLEQFQASLTHLSNLQLASDNHIDLVELAAEVFRIIATDDSENQAKGEQNSTRTSKKSRTKPEVGANNLKQTHLDLFALALLSNLHWPLVKWRHQSQQPSISSSFLSFAVPGFSERPATSGPDGAQAIRSLLSSLILIESLSPQVVDQYANLRQIHKLHLNLRLISYHLATCSQQAAGNPFEAGELDASNFQLHRRHFCALLVRRYTRMMLAMGQLDHQDLAELHRLAPVELARSVLKKQPTAGSNRNILSWFLDQLSILDVHMLAEVTLTSDFSPNGIGSLPLLDDLGEDGESLHHDADEFELDQPGDERANLELLKSLLVTNRDQFEPKSGNLMRSLLLASGQLNQRDQKQETGNLYELVETFVGDKPIKRLISTKAADQETDKSEEAQESSWQVRFLNELSALPRQSQRWAELMAYDLLSPWPSYRLPKFMQPRNYDLFLHPNLTTRLVLGVNKIEFELERPTNFLILNCAHLNVIELSVTQLKAPTLKASTSSRDAQQVPSKWASTDRQVAIRRVLQLEHLEMLYIELEEQLEPATRLDRDQNGLKSFEFGELNVEASELSHAVIRNQFLLSVSFNKTNLMGSNSNGAQGVEFVRYADYFVPSSGSLPKESHDSSGQTTTTTLDEDENSLKALMFTNFNAATSDVVRGARASDLHRTRQIVPCLDEVQFRAKWQLNVVHDSNSQALSTGQRRERLPYNALGSLQMTIFEMLPVALSPNQLSIVVCDLNNFRSLSSRSQIPAQLIKSNSTTRHQVQVQVWAQLEHLNQAELLSQLVPPLFAFYQTHLNFVYPLDKLDLVALPEANQNSPGGDETRHGLGLLVLGAARARPLVDANLISQDLLERISIFVARQLAQQFLGNIVAPQSDRQDLWLFEALIEHLDSLAVGQAQPEWHLDKQFQVASLQEVLVDEQNNELAASAPIKLLAANWNGSNEFKEADNFAEATQRSRVGSARRSAAVVHMMLQTLLPSWESRAHLMQNLFQTFQFKSMSEHQFWRLFTRQLLETNLSGGAQLLPSLDERSPLVTIYPADEQDHAAQQDEHNATSGERVVFVSRRRQSASPDDDSHRVQASPESEAPAGDRSHRIRPVSHHRPRDQLELLANLWIDRTAFPLIEASCHRDTLHLRQSQFRVAPKWTSEYEEQPVVSRRRRHGIELEGAPEVSWPIPLLFISRLNPKSARFVWFDRHEMELALEADAHFRSGTPDAFVVANSSSSLHHGDLSQLLTSSSSAKLPQQYSWFKLNHNGSSLVRVNYDERNWEALISLLTRAHYSNHPLNQLDRANLLDDALTLMRFGHLSVNLAMNLTLYLELGERDYQPWQTIIKHLDQLQTLLNQNPLWHQYVLKLIQPISIVVGWKDDGPHLMRKLRRELYQLAIQYGDEKILAKARHEFRQWAQKSSQFIVPNLQELVYVAGVRYGDQQEWFHCWQKYQQLVAAPSDAQQLDIASKVATSGQNPIERNSLIQNTPIPLIAARTFAQNKRLSESRPVEPDSSDVSFVRSEQRQLLTALASTQNTWLLEQFLNYSLDPSKIQPYHLSHVVKTLGKNPVARLYLWRFVRLNWLELLQRFAVGEQQKWSAQSEQQAGAGQFSAATGDTAHDQPASILETMISESTKHFATRPDYEEVSAFFEAKIKAGQPTEWSDSMKRTVRASLATIRANIHWRNSIEPKLTRWLSHFNSLS